MKCMENFSDRLSGNRLERLLGDRVGQWSIRVNDQWRICFVWRDDGAHAVELVDYHQGAGHMDLSESSIRRADLDAGRVDLDDASEPGTGIDAPIPPGEHVAEFLDDYGWSARELARRLAVPHNRVLAILGGQRAISADTALRLARLFRTSPELWLNLQMRYDLDRLKAAEATRIAREVWPVERS